MNEKQILSFIDEIQYDFETIRYLLEIGREKESLIVLDHVFSNIDAFSGQIKEGACRLEGVFGPDFWQKESFSGRSALEIRAQVHELSLKWDAVSREDLKKINYDKFVNRVEAWIFENVALIRKKVRSKFDRALPFIWGSIIFAGVVMLGAPVVLDQMLYKNYGLKGEFFEGDNFQKLLKSRKEKVINFFSVDQIGAGRYENFSIRWQGYFMAPEKREYALILRSNDQSTFFLDGQPILMSKSSKDNGRAEKKVLLEKGPHKIVLEYFQGTGPAWLKLLWRDGKDKEVPIPAKYLRTDI